MAAGCRLPTGFKDRFCVVVFNPSPTLHFVDLKTTAGVFRLEFSGKGLYRIRFPEAEPLPESLREVFRVFRKYLSAKLDSTGLTPFQKKVYSVLMKVPEGMTISYGALAVRADSQKRTGRGNRDEENRLPLVIRATVSFRREEEWASIRPCLGSGGPARSGNRRYSIMSAI